MSRSKKTGYTSYEPYEGMDFVLLTFAAVGKAIIDIILYSLNSCSQKLCPNPSQYAAGGTGLNLSVLSAIQLSVNLH